MYTFNSLYSPYPVSTPAAAGSNPSTVIDGEHSLRVFRSAVAIWMYITARYISMVT